jgi:hypothetical protein
MGPARASQKKHGLAITAGIGRFVGAFLLEISKDFYQDFGAPAYPGPGNGAILSNHDIPMHFSKQRHPSTPTPVSSRVTTRERVSCLCRWSLHNFANTMDLSAVQSLVLLPGLCVSYSVRLEGGDEERRYARLLVPRGASWSFQPLFPI